MSFIRDWDSAHYKQDSPGLSAFTCPGIDSSGGHIKRWSSPHLSVAWTVHIPFRDWGQASLAEIWPQSRGGAFSLQRGHSQPRAITVGLACSSPEALPHEEGRGGVVTCPQGTRHSPSSSHTHYLLGCPTECYCGNLTERPRSNLSLGGSILSLPVLAFHDCKSATSKSFRRGCGGVLLQES